MERECPGRIEPYVAISGFLLLSIAVACGAALLIFRRSAQKARKAGYPSLVAYLRAAPRTDQEKRDAADLALKRPVLCLAGLFAPFRDR